jgi:thioesterase domain-containing protein
MTNPTVRSLASAIHAHTQRSPDAYDPVVVLQQSGPKLPLWLFHPGVGEVLVFLGLAKFLTDRPVYAFRARGFEPGQAYFENIDEAVAIYHTAIKERQSIGPYAMAGYSYGSMLAFETAKVLEKNGDEVRFLGVFNLPPHIKFRMRQLDWKECLLNLAYFLDLITEQRAHELSSETASFSREKALEHVMGIANPERVKELSLTHESISTWAGLAFSLQRMAVDYDPSGEVMCMDVFYCTPLAMVAQSRPEWLDNYLKPWNGFCRTEPRFHEVGGSHYTMIGAHHVLSFQKKLKQVLKERNV